MFSWKKAKPFLKFLDLPDRTFYFHEYTGECSYYGMELIQKIVEEKDIDFIIGVGGGKLSDLVGFAGHCTNVPFGLIPTLVSNCAPWTPLSVMYEENGASTGGTEHFKRQAAFLITDPYLTIDSPVRYFVAGLADTIAKWYESESILAQEKLQSETFPQLAGYVAKVCNDAIVRDSKKAIEDMKQGNVSDEFVRLSEIVIAVAGLCGGLGDKYARNAAAHAMHDGMAKLIEDSHRFLHGEKVAYGILYQMALEKHWSTIDSLMPFYKDLNLPLSLHQMGLYPKDEKVIDELVAFIDSKQKVHLIPTEVNVTTLKQALYELEEYMKKYED